MAFTFNPFTGSFDAVPSTLKGDNAYTTVNANSATWGTGSGASGAYLPLSGGTMTGKLTAGFTATEAGINIGQGTVPTDSAIGDLWMQQYTLNWRSPVGIQAAAMTNGSNTFNRPQIISLNDNDPALRITQTGSGDSIVIEDSANPDITSFIVNSAGSVGVGVSNLFEAAAKLTVVGSISSTDVIIANGGNSDLWNNAYTNLVTNSAAYLSGSDLSFLSVSANWNSVYSNVNANSAQWAIDSTTDTGVRSLTSNWENTYTTVQSNSSTWNYQGSDIRALTAGWVGGNAAYTNLVSNSAAYLSGTDLSFLTVSANWNSVYSNVNANSASWSAAAGSAGADLAVRALTANWQNTYSTVLANSATTWNYQGSDIRALTAGWVGGNDAYTNLIANSAAYLSGVDLSFLSVSGNWNSVYSNVNANSASWNYQGNDLKSLSSNWESTYTTVLANSASWAIDSTTDTGVRALTSNWQNTYTTVIGNSATWDYQGTDIKALTAGWVGGNDAYTNLVSNSAAYLSAVDLSFLSVSANWNSVYTTVNTNSAVLWNYQGNDIKALSGTWQDTYSTVLANSASWAVDSTADTGVRALTSNWESTYTTVSSNSANWQALYTTVQTNSSTWFTTGSADRMVARVYNADTVTLNKGNVVYTFGATGDVMSVKRASNVGDETSARTLGFVNETIPVGGIGYVVITGQIDKMSLPHQTYSEGDILWLGSALGSFTNVKPVAPSHSVYLGVVERANNGDGLAYVKIQNGVELDELHDVLITSVSANQVLRRNSTNNLWINTNDGNKWDSVYTNVNVNSGVWSIDNQKIYKNTNFNAEKRYSYVVDTSTNTVTATLPSSPSIGDTILFQDFNLTWKSNNFTINSIMDKIQSLNEPLNCDLNGLCFSLTYFGNVNGWRID